jgi:hemoglobin
MAYGTLKRASLAFVLCVAGLGACSDDDDSVPATTADAAAGSDAAKPDATAADMTSSDAVATDGSAVDAAATDAAEGDAAEGDASGADAAATLYDRLGGVAGIQAKLTQFVGIVMLDNRINGYFLNSTLDGTKFVTCLTLFVGKLTGGPQEYPNAQLGCRDMKTAHTGLKISKSDFDALAEDMVMALVAAGISSADIAGIAGGLGPLVGDIVEDPSSNGTVYQRVGRKPAIMTVIDKFVTRVVGDARINGFFSAANADRLKTCLVRQVCSVDGPCKYGAEITGGPEKGVSMATPCKDMMAVHTGLTKPPGGGAGTPITKADFDALVEDLVMELDAAGVTPADKGALTGALAPLCPKIVAGGTGCP